MEPREFPRRLKLEWTPPKPARRRERAPRRLPRTQEKVCGVKAVSSCKTWLSHWPSPTMQDAPGLIPNFLKTRSGGLPVDQRLRRERTG